MLKPCALPLLLGCLSLACAGAPPGRGASTARGPRIAVRFPKSLSETPLDGRVLVALVRARADSTSTLPPIDQLSDEDDSAQLFGLDVEALAPEEAAVIDGSRLGYPLPSLSALPAGDYLAQAVLHRYQTFTRSDGHTVKLPPDRGEGQDWRTAPGNLISAITRVHIDPDINADLDIELARALPQLPEEPDTNYVKHIRIKSERLSAFWGTPVHLGAIVLLPEGFASHPQAHYPLVIEHGHFEREVVGFREQPPEEGLPPVDLDGLNRDCPTGHEKEACANHGYERFEEEQGYANYRLWTGRDFPRVLGVSIQHANPYYDDSYAVNSENLGPYGDAITYELIPYIEKTYRGLGPWARGLMGGSTGGWESLAAQVFYPTEYNGAVANCPDPIDFRSYMTIDLYTDRNAYYHEGPFRRTPRPASRDAQGETLSTVEQENHEELVVGTHGRSGGQWDIWQAVYSPRGMDGYPQPIWEKLTGDIDPQVAAYWREHYDLGHILARDWARLGPLLRGKISINVGLADDYFLNNAVYRVEEFLQTASPPADAQFDYGLRDGHCWSGDHLHKNFQSRLTYRERFIPRFVEHWLKTAPAGADLTSWRY